MSPKSLKVGSSAHRPLHFIHKLSFILQVLYFVVTRLFLAFHGLLYMFLWRGCWSLADHYIPRTWTWALLALILDLFLMSVLRVGRATMWPPFMVTVDTSPSLLVADNRFKVPVSLN